MAYMGNRYFHFDPEEEAQQAMSMLPPTMRSDDQYSDGGGGGGYDEPALPVGPGVATATKPYPFAPIESDDNVPAVSPNQHDRAAKSANGEAPKIAPAQNDNWAPVHRLMQEYDQKRSELSKPFGQERRFKELAAIQHQIENARFEASRRDIIDADSRVRSAQVAAAARVREQELRAQAAKPVEDRSGKYWRLGEGDQFEPAMGRVPDDSFQGPMPDGVPRPYKNVWLDAPTKPERTIPPHFFENAHGDVTTVEIMPDGPRVGKRFPGIGKPSTQPVTERSEFTPGEQATIAAHVLELRKSHKDKLVEGYLKNMKAMEDPITGEIVRRPKEPVHGGSRVAPTSVVGITPGGTKYKRIGD